MAALNLGPGLAGRLSLAQVDAVTRVFAAAFYHDDQDRLLAVSRAVDDLHPREWVEQVVAAVQAHVETAEQSDDLTLLAAARPLSLLEPTVEPSAHDS